VLKENPYRFDIVQHGDVGGVGVCLRPSLEALKKVPSCFGFTRDSIHFLLDLTSETSYNYTFDLNSTLALFAHEGPGKFPTPCNEHLQTSDQTKKAQVHRTKARTTSHRRGRVGSLGHIRSGGHTRWVSCKSLNSRFGNGLAYIRLRTRLISELFTGL
jgi:hypothetical protein